MNNEEIKKARVWMKNALLYDYESYDDCGEVICTKLAEDCADELNLYENEDEGTISEDMFELAVDVANWYEKSRNND